MKLRRKMEDLVAHVSVLCLSMVVVSSELITLVVSPEVVAACNSNVTLHCNISSSEPPVVKSMVWMEFRKRKELCKVQEGLVNSSDGVYCDYQPQEYLALTLPNVGPSTKGTYTCQITSNRGIKRKNSTVGVQGCFREPAGKEMNRALGKNPTMEQEKISSSANRTGKKWILLLIGLFFM